MDFDMIILSQKPQNYEAAKINNYKHYLLW